VYKPNVPRFYVNEQILEARFLIFAPGSEHLGHAIEKFVDENNVNSVKLFVSRKSVRLYFLVVFSFFFEDPIKLRTVYPLPLPFVPSFVGPKRFS